MAATALAVLNYLDEHQVLAHAKPVADVFQKALRAEISNLPNVGSVTGLGHIAGVEFVADKKSKTPFPIAKKFALKFVAHAQEQGLILWPNYGQADGVNGDLALLGPALTITASQALELVALLKHSIETFRL
jgi:adenosylmethionine-8-amino-7-oxononanoate aminotransferase